MRDMVNKKGLDDHFEIASCATSTEELGNRMYPPVRKKLAEHGIYCDGKTARQMTKSDYRYYDFIIAMENYNIRSMTPFTDGDPDNKVSLLMDYTNRPGDVADPWYTRDFDATWQDITEGCAGLLKELVKKC